MLAAAFTSGTSMGSSESGASGRLQGQELPELTDPMEELLRELEPAYQKGFQKPQESSHSLLLLECPLRPLLRLQLPLGTNLCALEKQLLLVALPPATLSVAREWLMARTSSAFTGGADR
eukprot:CAMPEP_0181486148 /NCGR_PEP_ID=MMETSP1110-20121109/46961_1 /TAXON_ID=174948 /ORGANISM="Symbiodinium sp., Strain CCMP421" /LENGTH=119 /DNA_ID=CAMNT_0023612229 /DNA_START=233 /DNA_END=588 /DNA_ORIENTATION=+